MGGSLRHPWLALLAVSLCHCIAEPDYTGRLCNPDAPCPSGYVCGDGRCALAGLGPPPDAGLADATPDAAPVDASAPDAADAGLPPDDAGDVDSGAVDAGPALLRVELSPATAELVAGRRLTFTAEAVYADGLRIDVTESATWSVEDGAILEVANGEVRGLTAGASFVAAEVDAVAGRADVTVTPAVPVGVSAFNKHNLVWLSDGRLFAWGWNSEAQVDGSGTEIITRPVQVPLTDVEYARAAGVHSVAVRADGSVWAWGNNGSGQLGRGELGSGPDSTPRAVVAASGSGPLTGVDDIVCGYDFCLALMPNGEVLAWGANSFGALGQGGMSNPPSGTPTPIPGLTDVVEIAAGTYHGVARTRSGDVWAWGYDEYGQLGQGSLGTEDNVPRRVVGAMGAGLLSGATQIAAGWGHTLARTNDGRVLAWGWAAFRQLGPSRAVDDGTPAFLVDAGLNPLTGARRIAAGFTFGLVRTNADTLTAWGNNSFGQLGDGTITANRPEPGPVLRAAGGALSGVTAFAGGGDHAVAIVGDEVWAWGSNEFGELGDGAGGMGMRSASPTRVDLP